MSTGARDVAPPDGFAAAAAATLVGLVAVGLWAFMGTGRSGGVPAEPSEPAATVATSPAPAVAPSLTARPPTTADRALAALDDVDVAIAATSGRGGLKGKERNELERLATTVRSALDSGDLRAARAAAGELADKVDGIEDELDEERARRLADTVEALVERLAAG